MCVDKHVLLLPLLLLLGRWSFILNLECQPFELEHQAKGQLSQKAAREFVCTTVSFQRPVPDTPQDVRKTRIFVLQKYSALVHFLQKAEKEKERKWNLIAFAMIVN